MSEVTFPEIIKKLHLGHSTGLLRLTQRDLLHAVFIENGSFVFAISNSPAEQLLEILLTENKITQLQYSELAKETTSNVHKILSERKILPPEELTKFLKKQVANIILNIFTLETGEFFFEEHKKTTLKLDLSTPNIILNGIRNITNEILISKSIGPTSQKIKLSQELQALLKNVELDNTEGFILSRASTLISIEDLISVCNFQQLITLRTVLALLCIGVISIDHTSEQKEQNPITRATSQLISTSKKDTNIPPANSKTKQQTTTTTEKTEQEIQEEFKQVLYLHSLKSTTHYTVLNVTSTATEADIKAAYYKLAKNYHPDHFRHYKTTGILNDAEHIFARITEAYEKLHNPESRYHYDQQLGTTHSTEISFKTLEKESIETLETTLTSTQEVILEQSHLPPPNKQETAEHNFFWGREAFEKRDLTSAIDYLQKAVQQAPEITLYRLFLAELCTYNPKLAKEAETQLLYVIKTEPNNVKAHLLLGKIYKQLGLTKNAKVQFEEVLKIQPTNKTALQELSNKTTSNTSQLGKKTTHKESFFKRFFGK